MPARLGVVMAVVAALGLAGCSGPPSPQPVQVYAVSARSGAPALAGPLLSGEGSFDLAAHRGDVVVLNFWASWCAPCRVEADDLEQTYQATRSSRVTFLGINIRDERDKARAFAAGRASYPSIFDPSSRLALGFNVPPTTIPATIVIDRAGRIAVVIRGAVIRSELEPLVTQIASEVP
jgi:thiol-disulfide isomerase/thioredoxin